MMAKFSLQTPTQRPQAEDQPEIDPVALEAFAAGAKTRCGVEGKAPPWEPHNPDAVPKYNVTIRMNDHQLEMLRYLTGIRETSQSKFLQKLVLPIIKQLAEETFEKLKGQ